MILWMINLSALVLSGFFTDIRSESVIESTLCPLLFVIFLINIVCKFYAQKGQGTKDDTGWVCGSVGDDDYGDGGGGD